MDKKDRNAYIAYRLEKADETYEAALLLFNNAKWNSAINRLYYSCFYAVSALLFKNNINAKSHSGVKSMFFLHFIKCKIIDINYGKLYADLFDWRQKGDYGDFFDFNKEDVVNLLEPTKNLIEEIKKLLKH